MVPIFWWCTRGFADFLLSFVGGGLGPPLVEVAPLVGRGLSLLAGGVQAAVALGVGGRQDGGGVFGPGAGRGGKDGESGEVLGQSGGAVAAGPAAIRRRHPRRRLFLADRGRGGGGAEHGSFLQVEKMIK